MKIQDVTLNAVIAENNEKRYARLQLSIPGTQGAYSDKIAP